MEGSFIFRSLLIYLLSVDMLPPAPGGGLCCMSACRADGELTAGWCPAAPARDRSPPAMDTGGMPGRPARPGGSPTGGPPMPGGIPGRPLLAAACCWKERDSRISAEFMEFRGRFFWFFYSFNISLWIVPKPKIAFDGGKGEKLDDSSTTRKLIVIEKWR